MAAKQRAKRDAAARGMRMTTIELPPALHEAARVYAIRHRMTFRQLVEQGIRTVMARKESER
jgi:hypothetical protein